MNNFIERLIADGYIRPGEKTNPLVVVLRIMAMPVVRMGVALGINPNIVTLVSIALGLGAAWLYFIGLDGAFFIAWTASVILDYADGTIARRAGKASHFGYLLDMLGDRLKLLALVFVWWLVNGTLTADLLTGFVALMLVSIEIVTHVFVRQAGSDSKKSPIWRQPLVRMFLEFNMHSFFVLGVCLAIGDRLDRAGLLWLGIVLIVNFIDECRLRLVRHGTLCWIVNPKILKAASIRSSQSTTKKNDQN